MIKLQQNIVSLFIALLVITGLSACGSLNKFTGFLGDKGDVNYQKNASVKSLEFPPDLTAPEFDKSFELPTGIVSAVSIQNGGSVAGRKFVSSGSNLSRPAPQTRTGSLSSVRSRGGETVLQINDSYQRALILTDIMLERMGFAVVSRNSSTNVLSVRYNGSDIEVGQPQGRVSDWLNRTKGLLGSANINNKALVKGEVYQVFITSQQGVPLVRFKRAAGKALSAAAHAKIIALLNTEFNR